MNLKLLPVLCVLFLTACATRTVSDDSPASDLDVLVANVQRLTRPTLLPNGREYCAELADTADALDDCTGDLEDSLFNANARAEKTFNVVNNFADRERRRRNPCKWYQLRCKD